MKKLLLPFLAATAPWFAMAQKSNFCGTSEINRKARLEHPETEKSRLDLEQFTKDYTSHKNAAQWDSVTPRIIPIVFHIIHNYSLDNGDENISDAQVIDQVKILNEDFMKLNSDTNTVIPIFRPIIGKAKIQFRLATKDVLGNCTNGIEHIYSYQTNVGNDASKLNPWPRDRYLNVWVVRSMRDGVAGYAYYPSSTNTSGIFSSKDGIIILSDYIGSIGTGGPGRDRALTHEIGHWLNLSHPWGDNNNPGEVCGDDNVDDTPETKGWNFCPSAANAAVCNDTIVENYQNFMDYSYCSFMFSEGQCDRMNAALSSSVSGRNNLWTDGNLEATGTADPYVFPPACAPLSDFYSERYFACVGEAIKFHDVSQRAAVDSREWSVPGATPSTSTDANPLFTFNAPGLYTATLTVTNENGSSTKTWEQIVEVRGGWSEFSAPFTESFTDFNTILTHWSMPDKYSNQHKWNFSYLGGYGEPKGAVYFNNWESNQGDNDDLISPAYDLSYTGAIKLKFKYSFGNLASNFGEALKIYATSNCGKNWTQIKSYDGADLANAGAYSTAYYANDDRFWTEESVTVSATFKKPNVRFKFVFTSAGDGNNLWLDDINVDGTVGIDEKSSSISFLNVYPNPSEGSVSVRFEQILNNKAKLSVVDMLGNVVSKQDLGTLNAGQHDIKVEGNFANGLYVVVLESGESRMQSRFVVSK